VRRHASLLCVVLPLGSLALLIASCSAPFNGQVYRGHGFAFRSPDAPPAWSRIEVSHASLAFRDDRAQAIIAVNGRCESDRDDVPLGALTHHLFIGMTDREVVKEEVQPFDGREALHSIVVAKLDGVPQKFDVWVMKKDGCVFDLYFVAPPDRYAAGEADFERFVRGFATVPKS
jgi:hypothetical protein